MKELLDKRRKLKAKKPKYRMQDTHKLSRLSFKWRKPRGIDSKMRLNLKGYRASVEIGYGSPKEVRGLSKNGLLPVIVSNERGLLELDKEKQGVIIDGKIGARKRLLLIRKCIEQKIMILNIKDPDNYIKGIEGEMEKRKTEKKKKVKVKADKKAKEEKKAKSEDKLADKVQDAEEKVALEKKEKDKLLTKRDL